MFFFVYSEKSAEFEILSMDQTSLNINSSFVFHTKILVKKYKFTYMYPS